MSESLNLLNLPKGEDLLPPENIGRYFEIINPEGIKTVVVDIGQPRISSTARAALAASLGYFDEVHFQPWKYVQRYALPLEIQGLNPQVFINKQGKEEAKILLKETPGGPNDIRENFDPVAILLERGLKPDQIRVMLGIREPFAQFVSWIKFDKSRQPTIFLEGQRYILYLLDNYYNKNILCVPFVFELFYPNPQEYLNYLYQQLGLDIVFPQGLNFVNNPPVIWHEADPQLDQISGLNADVGSSYFDKVVRPVLNKGRYEVPQLKIPDRELILKYQPLMEAAIIYIKKAEDFYNQSLRNGFSSNKDFEVFLNDYQNMLKIQ